MSNLKKMSNVNSKKTFSTNSQKSKLSQFNLLRWFPRSIFGQNFDKNDFCGQRCFRPKIFSAKDCFGQKYFRPKNDLFGQKYIYLLKNDFFGQKNIYLPKNYFFGQGRRRRTAAVARFRDFFWVTFSNEIGVKWTAGVSREFYMKML